MFHYRANYFDGFQQLNPYHRSMLENLGKEIQNEHGENVDLNPLYHHPLTYNLTAQDNLGPHYTTMEPTVSLIGKPGYSTFPADIVRLHPLDILKGKFPFNYILPHPLDPTDIAKVKEKIIKDLHTKSRANLLEHFSRTHGTPLRNIVRSLHNPLIGMLDKLEEQGHFPQSDYFNGVHGSIHQTLEHPYRAAEQELKKQMLDKHIYDYLLHHSIEDMQKGIPEEVISSDEVQEREFPEEHLKHISRLWPKSETRRVSLSLPKTYAVNNQIWLGKIRK